jgi:hypothetical protein
MKGRTGAVISLVVLAMVPTAAAAGKKPKLALKGPAKVETEQEYHVTAAGRAKSKTDVVKIFVDLDACATSAAAETTDHHNRLLTTKAVGQKKFSIESPPAASEFPGKTHYCGYLSTKSGSTYRRAEKTIKIQG